jgi:hypothetical protein
MAAMYGNGQSSASTGPTGLTLGAFGAPGAWDGGYNATYQQPAPQSQPQSLDTMNYQAPSPTTPVAAPQAPPAVAADASPPMPQFSGGSVSMTSAGLQPTPGTVTPGGPGWSASLPSLDSSWFASQKDADGATADQNALGGRLAGAGYNVTGGNQAAPAYQDPSSRTSAPLQTSPVAPVFSMPTDQAGRNQRYNQLLNQGYTDAQIATNPYFLNG